MGLSFETNSIKVALQVIPSSPNSVVQLTLKVLLKILMPSNLVITQLETRKVNFTGKCIVNQIIIMPVLLSLIRLPITTLNYYFTFCDIQRIDYNRIQLYLRISLVFMYKFQMCLIMNHFFVIFVNYA